MDWTRLQLLAMGSNQKDVIKGRVFFVYKLYECFFMPRMEATSGIGI
jgi:hypothetical protein